MTRLKIGAVVTALIGALWASLALIYISDESAHDVTLGVIISVAGIAMAAFLTWIERRLFDEEQR